MKQLKNKYVLSIVFVLASFVVYCFYLNYSFSHRSLLASATPTSVKVYPGFHINQLANELKQQQLWHHPNSFMLLATLHGYSDQLRFGEYTITPDMSALMLLKNIASSTGLTRHKFRIPEGSTVTTVLALLKNDPNIFKASQPVTIAEGSLYPDTYQFVWGVTDKQVVAAAAAVMQKKLASVWAARDATLPISSPAQLVIVASLIETETSNLQERPMIAGVIYNRLKQHMRLQVDPSVTYGLGLPYGSALVDSQLKTKTPYNTYMIDGLPPTPIAMPSLTSLIAAAHPAQTHALYYVADGKGSHVFSATYALHLQAVAQYHAYMQQQSSKQGS